MDKKDLKSLEFDKVLQQLADFCYCEDAKELIFQLTPAENFKDALLLMSETEEAHKLLAKFGGVSFGGLSNIDNALTRASMGGSLNPSELLRIAGNLSAFHAVLSYRNEFSGVKTLLDKYFSGINQNKYLEEKIKTAIISEDEISDRASVSLANIRRRISVAENKVRESLNKIIRNKDTQKLLQESIITQRDGRYVVPVKAENQKDIPGLVHDMSQSGATLFIEPTAVVEANNELKILKSKEKDEIEKILFELSQEAGSFASTIKNSYTAALMLSVIFAKANYGYSIKASVPIFNDKQYIYFRNARHPLLAKDTAVPVSVSLGKDFDSLIITGPNTGGKTVTLKTIGLLSVMACCGLMLPVDDQSEASFFSDILSDIGDEQSIEQSLSTFSAHMTNIKRILTHANGKSLVLIDELGAGTDPIEGAALAQSVLEELKLKGAKTAVTTHYAELKAYALKRKGTMNASCEFDVETLRPTYKLIIGTIGRSQAFAISERLGIDKKVIDRASEFVSSSDKEFEDVVKRLEETRMELEKSKTEAEYLRREAEINLNKSKKKIDELEKSKEKEIQKAEEIARGIVEDARQKSNKLISELEDMKKEYSESHNAESVFLARQIAKSGINNIEDAANPVIVKDKGDYVLPRPLKAGDRVLVTDIDKEGDVLSYKKGDSFALISAGIFKTKVPLENLRLIEGNKKKSVEKAFRPTTGIDTRVRSVECDIRGMDTIEGLDTLDKFIDDSVLSRISLITVIHGKGTGALRKAVQDFLRRHKSVKSFRSGVYGEGENGVTIVELK